MKCIPINRDPGFLDQIANAVQENPDVETNARRFALFADPSRLRLIAALFVAAELCVCELATILRISQGATSQHLSKLHQAGLLQKRRSAQTIFYRLAKESLEDPALRSFLRLLAEKSTLNLPHQTHAEAP
jgi:DNA-binding transcriptional ArsR family regulator